MNGERRRVCGGGELRGEDLDTILFPVPMLRSQLPKIV
jgi:hypothetical protein